MIRKILTVVLFASVSVGIASAHTTIKTTNIESGAVLSKLPDYLEFSFAKPVGLAALTLSTKSGTPVEIAFDRSKAMKKSFSVPLPELEPDAYVIEWRAVATDGHVMNGKIQFTLTRTAENQ